MKATDLIASSLVGMSLYWLFSSANDSVAAESAAPPLASRQLPLAAQSLVLDITAAAPTLVAVGERGHILLLSDNGKDWLQQPVPSRALLTRVFFLAQNSGWAVGHDATILHSDDGGHSWQLQYHDEQLARPLLDVLFLDVLQGFAVGAYGLLLRTDDGGKHWRRQYHPELLADEDQAYMQQLQQDDIAAYRQEMDNILPHFNRLLRLADGRLLLLGEMGLVAVSTDDGHSWRKLPLPYEGSLFAAQQLPDGRVFVGGLRGHLFVSHSNLADWQAVPLPLTTSINGLVVLDGQLWLCGNSGGVWRLAGAQFQPILQRKGESLLTLAKDAHGIIWLAGSKGLQQLTQP